MISDQAHEGAKHFDRFLINPWGIASDGHDFWIANNGSGRLSVVDENGKPDLTGRLHNRIVLGDGITGIAFNTSSAFSMHVGASCGTAQFLVANEKGQILALNTDLSLRAQVVIDRSAQHASYKGLAIVDVQGVGMEILATDFHNARIDVFDASFNLISSAKQTKQTMFVDKHLAAGMAPFNVVAIQDKVYVTYAVQDSMKADAVDGVGNGRVDVFDLQGNFVKVLVDKGLLNAPWGVALAPANFCNQTANQLIIGNFGDGTLLAVNPDTGRVVGQLLGTDNAVLKIDGLWSLMFGDSKDLGQTSELFFTSGPDDEQHGVFGKLVSNENKTPQ